MRLRIVASAVAALALAVSAVGIIGASATQAGAAATGNCSAPPSPRVDWSGCNLAYANLYGANLTYATLIGANLTYAYLSHATLTGANLYGANLGRAILISANLTGANLYGADLSSANLYRADLTGANLYGANLYGADCSYATWPDGTSDHGRTCPPTARGALLAANDQDTGYCGPIPDDGAGHQLRHRRGLRWMANQPLAAPDRRDQTALSTPGLLGGGRRTEGSSPSVTLPSTVRWVATLNAPIVGIGATPLTERATGWWPVTAGSSPSETLSSPAQLGASSSISPSSVWHPPPTARATGWWPATVASSPSATPPSTARPETLTSPARRGYDAYADGKGYWCEAQDAGCSASEMPGSTDRSGARASTT